MLGILGLCVLAYGAYRWTGRNDAANERKQLVEWASEFSIPGSLGNHPAETKERDCPAGRPRRAERTERSTRDQAEILPDVLSQAASLGWTTNRPGLPVVGKPLVDVKRPAATYFKKDWELEVWLAPLEDGTEVRLLVTTGTGGLLGCY